MRRRDFILLLAGAMTAARALRAQQKAMPVVGYLNPTSPAIGPAVLAAFRQGLSEAGYVEEKTSPSSTAGQRVTMIGCLRWPPTSSAARSA